MTYQLVGSILILYLKQRNKLPEDHLRMNWMQCWVFIKKIYSFYRDLEQFNEKAVGVFSWFENVQLAIGLGAKIDEWRRRRLFRGRCGQELGGGVR